MTSVQLITEAIGLSPISLEAKTSTVSDNFENLGNPDAL